MDSELPSEYDVIVVGTGMVESIVAAAVSRCGKRVLHLDTNTYYGQLWATLTLEQFMNFLGSASDSEKETSVAPSQFENFSLLPLVSEHSKTSGVFQQWFIPETAGDKGPETSEKELDQEPNQLANSSDDNRHSSVEPSKEEPDESRWDVDKIKSLSRKFNIDLFPKIIYSKGAMVQLLVQSKVSRYMEFLNVTNVLALIDSVVHNVPCCKADVFSSKDLSVIDKRVLMKQLEIVLNRSENDPILSEWNDKTFAEYLKSQKLSSKLYYYILHGIAMSTDETPFLIALKKVDEFLRNLGHFHSNSPFLWPVYGSGELLQAFCRLCAVYGGIYYLNRGADFIAINKESGLCEGVISNEKLLLANYVILSDLLLSPNLAPDTQSYSSISRAVLLTSYSLSGPSMKNKVCVMNIVVKGNLLNLIEVSGNSGACPAGFHVVHVTCGDGNYDHQSFFELLKPLFSINSQDTDKPKLFYYAFFTVRNSKPTANERLPSNIKVCTGLTEGIDFDAAIEQAKHIFESMFPTDSFLAPMPDPDSDDQESMTNESTSAAPDAETPEKGIDKTLLQMDGSTV